MTMVILGFYYVPEVAFAIVANIIITNKKFVVCFER
jgi:hypothetical protein